MSDYLDPDNEELLKDFFVEAQMQVDLLEQNILVLESDPRNHDAIDEIFRAAHTLKGASATVQMTELSAFTHAIEDVLDEIRGGALEAGGEIVDCLLRSIDIVKEMLASRARGEVFQEDVSEETARLRGFLSPGKISGPVPTVTHESGPAAPVQPHASGEMSEYDLLELKEAAGRDEVLKVTVSFDESNPMNSVGSIQVFAVLKALGQVLRTEPEFDKLYEDVFYPVVTYYVTSKQPLDLLKNRLRIPDVVLGAEIIALGGQPAPRVEGLNEKKAERMAEKKAEKKAAEEASPLMEHEKARTHEQEARRGGQAGSILRVDSRRIDNLLNLVSETVISKAAFNQIGGQFAEIQAELQAAHHLFSERLKTLFDELPGMVDSSRNGMTAKDLRRSIAEKYGDLHTLYDPFHGKLKAAVGKFRGAAQNLGRITGEFQEGVMRIRMVPISQIFSRFPRLVRDLSRSMNKKINLVIEGEDTELDKSVIEDLLDPLIHCVRNSIDHGIEEAEERLACGKPADGSIGLKASNEGSMIIIEISDDGRGIDVSGVRARAVERGIIHPSKNLSDVEAFNLIFEPGFSTAKTVTSISGRGVGLDVVRRQIEKLNGSVTVASERGRGTRFVIKLPLTLAIIQGLLVRVGREKYAIPITSVIDSHRIRPSDIKMIDSYEVFNVRDDVVSLLRLNRLFKVKSDEQNEYYYVVIVGSGEKKMGLIVDSLIGEEDVVIKPLRDQFTNSPGIAGANITGDGSVSLIIDVTQLLELGLRREMEERRRREAIIR